MKPSSLKNLMTQTLSEEELEQYQDVLNDTQVKGVIREYHKHEVLSGAKEMVTGFAKSEKFTPDELLKSIASIWLTTLSGLQNAFDSDFVQTWEAMPDVLVRVLLSQAVQSLHFREDELDLETAPETEAEVKEWTALLKAADSKEPSRSKQISILSHAFSEYQREAKSSEGLKLLPGDYLEVWTHLLLEVYVLSFMPDADMYYLLISNWHIFIDRFPEILETMVLLKGYEELMLPENADRLRSLIENTPELRNL